MDVKHLITNIRNVDLSSGKANYVIHFDCSVLNIHTVPCSTSPYNHTYSSYSELYYFFLVTEIAEVFPFIQFSLEEKEFVIPWMKHIYFSYTVFRRHSKTHRLRHRFHRISVTFLNTWVINIGNCLPGLTHIKPRDQNMWE